MSTGPVTIFCDGSAWEGAGGVGVVVIGPRSAVRAARWLPGPGQTNQTAELLAAIEGLDRALLMILDDNNLPPEVVPLRLYSDSAYLINCFREGWIANWRRKNWRKSGGGEVSHRPLWETIESLEATFKTVEWTHMRGHGRGSEPPSLVRWNAICDNLAHTARVERRSWERRTTR